MYPDIEVGPHQAELTDNNNLRREHVEIRRPCAAVHGCPPSHDGIEVRKLHVIGGRRGRRPIILRTARPLRTAVPDGWWRYVPPGYPQKLESILEYSFSKCEVLALYKGANQVQIGRLESSEAAL